MSRPIIPKNLNKTRIRIYKGYNLIDFIITVFAVALAATMGFTIPFPSLTLKILFTIFLLLILLSSLIPLDKNGTRVYHRLFYLIKFLSSTKTFTNDETKISASSSSLVPYKELYDDETFTIPSTGATGGKVYMRALKIEGFDITNQHLSDQNNKIRYLKDLFMFATSRIQLVKINQPLELRENIEFLNKSIAKVHASKLKDEWKKPRIQTLEENKALFNDGGILSDENMENVFYLVFYNSKVGELNNSIENAIAKLNNSGLKTYKANNLELANLIKNVYDPTTTISIPNELVVEHKNKLDKLFAFKKVQFFGKFVKFDKQYINYSVISEYPTFPARCWMYGLIDNDSTIVMDISTPIQSKFENDLNITIRNSRANLLSINKREITSIRKLENEIEVYEEIVESVARKDEAFKSINTYVITPAPTKKELFHKLDRLKKVYKEEGVILDNLTFRQFEGFSGSTLKPTDPLGEAFKKITTSTTIAEAFPFLSYSLKDKEGMFLGTNNLGQPTIVDQFKNLKGDPSRKNANCLVIGQAGSGKSTFMKVLIDAHIALGRNVLIIDPEREYKNLVNYYKGEWIDCGGATSYGNTKVGRFNPLQILATFTDENQNDATTFDKDLNNQVLISQHLLFLESWFKILYPDLSQKELRYLSKMLQKLYTQEDFLKEDILLKPLTSFPIIDDLINLMEKEQDKNKNNPAFPFEQHQLMIDLLINDFQTFGKFHNLYNGHSSIKSSSNPLMVFDVLSLLNSPNQNLLQAQLMLITSFIQNEINNNGLNSKGETVVLVDEAHLLIDSKKPIALDFMFQMIKRIRKRNGGVILITQNPDDFLGSEEIRKKTQAIMQNVQYSFFFNLAPKDVESVDQIYSSMGGLTQSQKEFLGHADQGQALFVPNTIEKQFLRNRPSKRILSIK